MGKFNMPTKEELMFMETGEGYGSYTRDLEASCSVYVLNGVIIKNRGDHYDLNNIIVETNKQIDIYCDEEHIYIYESILQKLKKYGQPDITLHHSYLKSLNANIPD